MEKVASYLSQIPDPPVDPNQKYPFYEKDVTSKQEVMQYLTTWLEKVDLESLMTYKDHTYQQLQGFRRAFVIHAVFVDPTSGKYLFAVKDDTDHETIVCESELSYDDLLDKVADHYCHLWGIKIKF